MIVVGQANKYNDSKDKQKQCEGHRDFRKSRIVVY